MNMKDMIPVCEFCANHGIEVSFISSLHESGLIEISTIEDSDFIHARQLQQLEKIVRLYYEMEINLEGIETVTQLLKRIIEMQDEITALKNRLRFYEESD